MTVAKQLAAHAIDTRLADLPVEARQRAAVYVLDSLGVGIAGSSVEGGQGLLRVASGWGAPSASVWGRGDRLGAPAAAFINAWQMHNQEYDCLHEGAVVHAMASVLPAALAAAETRGGVSGAELIVAVAVGVDIAAALGLASRAGFRFFRPATAGGFGAVAAAGRLLGLDRRLLEAAFAWQLAQVSGTMQAHAEGSPLLPVQVAFNARAALQSCELAALDFTPTRFVFEGPYGYLALFEGDFDLEPVLSSLGRDWRISELSHKPFPAGRATHGGIEGIMTLRRERPFTADDVAAVNIIGPPLFKLLCGRPDIPSPNANYARLCMAFIGAKVLLHGNIDLAHYRGAELTDPATHELAKRITVISDGNRDPNALEPQEIVITLKDATVLRWHCSAMLADPARRLSRDQHLTKFRRCLDFAQEPLLPGTCDTLIDLVDRLEQLADIRKLTEPLLA